MRLGISRSHSPKVFALLVVIGIIVCVLVFSKLMYQLRPVFKEYGLSYANNIANTIVNEAVSEAFSNENYGELTKITSGSVQTIETDTASVNRLKADIWQNLSRKIKEMQCETVSVPLGSAFDAYFLSGIGPQIPVKVRPVSVVNIDLRDEFTSAGINQVKHKLYLEVSMDMSFVGFVFAQKETITTTALIFETVIVGDTPLYYGNGTFAVAE